MSLTWRREFLQGAQQVFGTEQDTLPAKLWPWICSSDPGDPGSLQLRRQQMVWGRVSASRQRGQPPHLYVWPWLERKFCPVQGSTAFLCVNLTKWRVVRLCPGQRPSVHK